MNDGQYIELCGTVDSVIFSNEENGYTVCEIEEKDTGDPVVLTGTMPYLNEGDILTVRGSWMIHPTYGRQLKVVEYQKSLPVGKDQILRYLSSGAVKGVGPKTAEKIVSKFAEATFEILEKHPEWIAEIPGISKRKAAEIHRSFAEVSGARNVIIRFKDYLPDSVSMKLYKKWGGAAIDRVRENPYLLCEEFSGVGFAKADAVAMSFGIEKDSPFRLSGGIVSFLQSANAKEGHTCVPFGILKERSAELLGVDSEKVHDAILEMLVAAKLRVLDMDGERFIYLPSFYNAEKYIAKKLLLLKEQCATFDLEDCDRMIYRLEKENCITYDKLQREAIYDALSSGVLLLTGGPGTGKTTVIKAMISIFESVGMEVSLAAPTGRAAKRMSEATICEAKTVHRLLGMEYSGNEGGRFLKDENDRLDEDVFIIDESSMIDVLLMEAFLRAVKPGARVIFIGDADQLPPVGAGNAFSDLIDSNYFNTVRLKTIFRQESGSRIITNAHDINDGIVPDVSNKNDDFFFLPRETDEETAATIASLYKDRLPKKYGDETVSGTQIMSPSRKGYCGTENLNRMLQEIMNPPAPDKKERRRGDTVFREGDKVMQLKNNYGVVWRKDGFEGEGIFNGDIGTIVEIDNSEGIFTIDFDERICEYDTENLEELEHAWAITVHKSQGSEYPIVILPLCPFAPMLLTRNLFYTAVTRAKKMVILVGRKYIIQRMVDNDAQAVRYTGLVKLLEKERERIET
ncbi:MAG: ATP-dependent RecD-like DNA helicase [Clostridia bacterium]|nr:ATP-dependent RecD-like DNA helicase [Clostridia bacterium]